MFKESSTLYTIHIEFMFTKADKTKGPAVVISTEQDTYYVYPKTKKDCITKIRFAVEEAYKLSKQNTV